MKKTIRIIILIFAIGIITFSGYNLWNIYSEYTAGEKLYDNYANEFIINIEETPEQAPEEKEDKAIFSVDFNSLLERNKDVVGWLYVEDTPINYPIVQASDNNYYLRRLLDGSYNIAGSIFMDYKNSPDVTDLNTIVYGHNLKNGTMFSNLKDYGSQEYYENHPVMHLLTPQGSHVIQLIGGYQTNIYSNIYKTLKTEEELFDLYDEIIKLSTFKANISLNQGDRLITLSTCSEGGDESRYVLIGIIPKGS